MEHFLHGEIFGDGEGNPIAVGTDWTEGTWFRTGIYNTILCGIHLSGTEVGKLELQAQWQSSRDPTKIYTFDFQSADDSDINVNGKTFSIDTDITEGEGFTLNLTEQTICRIRARRIGGDGTSQMYVHGEARPGFYLDTPVIVNPSFNLTGVTSTFVYRPGGPTAGNVYGTFLEAKQAMSAVAGLKFLQFDGSLLPQSQGNPPVITIDDIGSHDMKEVRWVGPNSQNTIGLTTGGPEQPIYRLIIEIEEGVTFTNLRWIEGYLQIRFKGTATPAISDFSGIDVMNLHYGVIIECTDYNFFEINQTSQARTNITKFVMFGAEFRNSGYEVLNISATPFGAAHFETFDATIIGENTLRADENDSFAAIWIGARTVYPKSAQINMPKQRTPPLPPRSIFFTARSPQNKSAEIEVDDFRNDIDLSGLYKAQVTMPNYPPPKNIYTINLSYTSENATTFNITWEQRNPGDFLVSLNSNDKTGLLRVTWYMAGIFSPLYEI